MIHVTVDPKRGKFIASGPFTDIETLRSIPNRRYDKEAGVWICAPTRKNIDYFRRMKVQITEPAVLAMEAVEKGPVYKLGTLPQGFNFKTKPRNYQLECLLRGLELPGQALLMDPGTGKTKVVVDDSVACWLKNTINAVVVICPNSIKGNWEDELATHAPADQAVFVWEPERRKAFEKFMLFSTRELKWLIIGVESFSQGTAHEAIDKFLCLHRASILLDESSRVSNYKSIRTERVIKLGKLALRRRIMTGTPFDKKGFHKAWAQFEFLDPNILDMGWFAFKNRFCAMGGYKGKQIIASINKDEFIDMIAPYTYRANKYEVLPELPPKVYQIRQVEPTAQMRKLYEQLRDEGMAEVDGKMISYTNTLVRDLRLQQICGGFVALEDIDLPEDATEEQIIKRMDTVPCVPIEGANPKVEEIMNYLEELEDHKVILWCRFRPEIDVLTKALRAEFGAEAVVEFHGGVTRDKRDEARRSFQTDPRVQYFVGQVSTGGIGITLHAADFTLYYSNAWPLEDRIQSEDRVHRIGQEGDSVVYVDFIIKTLKSKPWVDGKVLNSLKAGKDYTESLMAEIHEATR